jgi:hypothetical protein
MRVEGGPGVMKMSEIAPSKMILFLFRTGWNAQFYWRFCVAEQKWDEPHIAF